jgi:tetratricopeptide (TPR) repeat protein
MMVSNMASPDLREQIFTLIYSKNKTEEAILQLNAVIKKTPENILAIALKAYALNKLANIHHDWKYSHVALEYADRCLALNPNDDLALTSKGWALIDLGKAREALPILEQAVRANPTNEYAWYNLAWAQYLTGDPAGSAESIAKALRISPGNPIIKRGKATMRSGKVPEHLKAKRS